MTQALLNNLANTKQLFTNKVSENSVVLDKNFQQLLEKSYSQDTKQAVNKKTDLQHKQNDSTVKNPISGTVGALKNVKNPLSEFTNLLADVATDVVNETALDVTLVKNTEEIVNDLEENADDLSEEVVDYKETSIIQEGLGIVDSVIKTVIEPVENDNSNNIDFSDSELKVTLNGKDLDSALQELGVNNNTEDELFLVNPAEPDEVKGADGKALEELVDEDTLKELNVESVETETPDNGENSDLMQNQTPEEQGVKALLNTHADYTEAKVEAKPDVSAQTKPANSSDVTPSKIIEQISKQLENLNAGSKVNIVLNPESLGKVSVQLINTKEGLSAQFTVASQDAKNLIMKGLDGLKNTLVANGVSVDNVSVKLNETQESEYNADWTEQEGSRGGNKEQNSRRGQKEEQEFEQMMSFAQDE